MKQKLTEKTSVLILMGLIIFISSMIITSYALFSGNHNLFTNKTTAQDFCIKCHPDKVAILDISTNVHKNAGCICHGYNPNVTQLYNINAAHNLTKNIYCTNCHTNYNSTTGNIMIHGGRIAAPNQSAHYLINASNKASIYQNAKGFFNNSKR
jgi:Eukaryotic translation initiation factor eIF2A